jgi:hypothetical protein
VIDTAAKPDCYKGCGARIKKPASLPVFYVTTDADYGISLSSIALSRTAPLSALVASRA